MAGNVHQDNHDKLKNRAQIVDEAENILDLVKEEDNLSASKHGMPVYAGDDSAPTRKWRAIRCDDHGRQEIHLTNVDHDEQFDFRNKDFDTGVGTEKVSVVGLALPAAGGSAIGGTAANPVRTDPTGTTTQPVSGTVTAAQTVAANLKATVTQLAKDRTVTNDTAANLKAEVTQAAKDRTVTNATAANLNATIYADPLAPLGVIQLNSNLLNAKVVQLAKDRTVTNATAANLKTEVSGTVTTNKGDTSYTKVKKTGFYTTQQTDTILWDPTAGKKFVITDIIVSVDTAMAVHLEDGTTKIWGWDFAANGGAVINLQTPDESSTADNNLTITMGASGKCSIKVLGYEV